MYKIVDNFMEASCFFTDVNLHYNVQLFKNNPEGFVGSLKIVKYSGAYYLRVINNEGEILGYMKFDKIKETKSSLVIPGEIDK